MLHKRSDFDGNLQMYREPPRPVSLAHLQFLRWLVEHQRLEEPAAGSPSGEFAELLAESRDRTAHTPITLP